MEKKEKRDLGLGSKGSTKRGLSKDGTFNVERRGISLLRSFEVYHTLIAMSWLRFSLLVVSFYVMLNLIFACLFVWVGTEHLSGIEGGTSTEKFLEAFFFSSQTVTTLGYGRIAPIGTAANVVAATESMIGLLGFALATGLLYGRFSRPVAKILYSDRAVIAPYQGMKAFMFRMVNQRSNQLIEVEVEVVVSMFDQKSKTRIFETLELERSRINFFPMNWTVVHPIDENSPISQISREELQNSDMEIIILVKAFDDTFSQTIYSRTSYFKDEIVWGAKFSSMLEQGTDGTRIMNIDKLDSIEPAVLPEEKMQAQVQHA